MYNDKTQGKSHKVAATQIREKVAEICSKYGIEFNDKDLRYNEMFSGEWVFTPYHSEEFGSVGFHRYNCNEPGLWHAHNINSGTYQLVNFKLLDEVAEVLSATATED